MRSRERLLELRNVLPFIIWVAALIVALNSGWEIAYRLLYLFSLLILFGLIWSGGAVWSLAISRDPLHRVLHVGDTLVERLQVRNRSFLPQLWVVLEDSSDMPLHRLKQVLSYIPPRAERQFVLRTICLRRGRYRLGPVRLTGGDPFGIFRTRRRLGSGGSVTVYPRVFHLEALEQLTGVLEADARRSRRSADATTDVSNVREYQPGDEFARIHWLSTARRGRLMSKEFEHNPGGDVWVVADLHRAVHGGGLLPVAAEESPRLHPEEWPLLEPATEEYVVSLAASTATYFLRADRSVGFLTHSDKRHLMQPDRGERQLTRILDLLAVAEADGGVPLERLIEREAHQFRRYDTVVIITPSDREEWVAAAHSLALRGTRLLVMSVDRRSFTGEPPSSRIQELLAVRRLPFCLIENGRRPDEALCHTA